MTLKPAAPLACLLAALVSTSTAPAHALSCALPEVVVPTPDSVHVPTNTLVWCSHDPLQPAAPIVLRDAEGASVSGTQTQMSLATLDVMIFRPAAELAPNSQYTVECPVRWQGQAPTHVFTTGPGSRSTPPAVPSISKVNVSAEDGGWGPSYHASFGDAAEPQTIVVIDLGATASLDPDAPTGAVSDAFYSYGFSDIHVGHGPCGGSWADANLGASTSVALGAFDMTGAFSGWSDTVTVTIPSEVTRYPEADLDDESSSDPPDVDAAFYPEGDANDLANPTVTDDGFVASSTGRSGCALGARSASSWWGAIGLLALACLGARRRR